MKTKIITARLGPSETDTAGEELTSAVTQTLMSVTKPTTLQE